MRTFTELPGPKGLPILGNLLQLDLKQLHRVLEKWTDEFGALYASKLGQRPVVVVAESEAVQMVLRNRPKLYRRLGTIEPVFNMAVCRTCILARRISSGPNAGWK